MKEITLFLLVFMSLRWAIAKNEQPFKPIMSIRLERCSSYCNPEYCNITTVCRPLNRTSKFVSMDIYMHPGVKIEAPIYVKIVTFMKFATVYRPHMLNLKTEVCKELSLRTHPLFQPWKDQFSANLLDPCPMTGHRHTKPRITNVYDYVTPLFRIVPAGQWIFDVTVLVERNGSEVVVTSWSDYYEVKSLTAEEF